MSSGDFIGFLIWALIMGGLTIFIIQPFFRKDRESVLENYYEDTPLTDLHARKNALYQSIKDVEFDFKTAKLSDEDYKGIRDKLEREAVELLEEIDRKESGKKKKDISSISKTTTKKTPGVKCPECGEKNQSSAKFCISCGTGLKSNVCGSCGFEHKSKDKFCPGCGVELSKS